MPIITHYGVVMLYAIMSNPKTNMRKVTETDLFISLARPCFTRGKIRGSYSTSYPLYGPSPRKP
jgi:hypothetical protein